jgi:hypothetical protein
MVIKPAKKTIAPSTKKQAAALAPEVAGAVERVLAKKAAPPKLSKGATLTRPEVVAPTMTRYRVVQLLETIIEAEDEDALNGIAAAAAKPWAKARMGNTVVSRSRVIVSRTDESELR